MSNAYAASPEVHNACAICHASLTLLAGYHASGYVPRDTFVWAQGRAEWQALHSVPELAVAAGTSAAATLDAADGLIASVRQIENAVDNAGDTAVQQAAAARVGGNGAAATAAPAVMAAPAAKHDPMAAFTAEISAIEAVSSSVRGPCHIASGPLLTPITTKSAQQNEDRN